MITCKECGKRINSNHAIKINNTLDLEHYCKKDYEKLFGHKEENCHYCRNFTYARDKYHSLQSLFILKGGETGLFGKCLKHNRKVTTHSERCADYEYAFKNAEPYCSKEHLIHDCALNDDCRRYDFDCDNCFTKEHWEEDVLQRLDEHVIDPNSKWSDGQIGVDCYTKGEGGYCDRRFDLHFEDGEIIEDVGLWNRGRCPNRRVFDKIRHAKIILR